MPSTYTASLRITQPATGELAGTWGDVINQQIVSLLEAAVAGYVSVSMADANYTLTTANGATDEARRMYINMTGALTAERSVIVPTASKLYFVANSTTGGFNITVKTAAGTGVSIPPGTSMAVMSDGTNVRSAVTAVTSLISTGNVGIGTAVPTRRLEISELTRAIALASTTSTTSTDAIAGYSFNSYDGTGITSAASVYQYSSIHTAKPNVLEVANYRVAPITFLTSATAGAAVERMRIDAVGNVGIGAATPGGKLDIQSGVAPALLVGADNGAGTRTNAALKVGRVAVPHYTNTELPAVFVSGVSTATDNVAEIGGNTASANGCTRITFSTTTSPTGAILATERMRINSAGNVLVGTATAVAAGANLQTADGITFPATAVASTDPNTLDDYEEGGFTPTITGTTTAGAGTYTAQLGRYQKVGNRVHYAIRIIWTAHTGTGNLQVSGLPFTAAATGALSYIASATANNLTFTGALWMAVNAGATTMTVATATSGAASAAVAMDTAADLIITGHYEV